MGSHLQIRRYNARLHRVRSCRSLSWPPPYGRSGPSRSGRRLAGLGRLTIAKLPGAAASTAASTSPMLSRIVAQCVVVRTTKARGWPDRFCWCSMFWSHVIMTAKPSACAAPISSPLPSVAQPIAAACVASRGRRSGIRCRGTLLSSRMRLPGISPCVIDDAPRPLNPQPWEQVVDLLGRGVVHVLGHAGRQDASTLHDRLAGHLAGNPFNVGTIGPVYFGRIAHGGARWFDCLLL